MANAIGMVFPRAGLGYTVVSVTSKSKVRFVRSFRIYALSHGATLLARGCPRFWCILKSGNGGRSEPE